MNRIRKAIVLIMTAAMIITSTCVPSLAAEKKVDPYASLKEGTGYVTIGDSTTRGYGASDHWEDQVYLNEYYGEFNCRNVDGSYPNYVAKKMGLKAPSDIRKKTGQLWPLAHNALTIAYVLDLLGVDDGYRDDDFLYSSTNLRRRYSTDLRYFGDPKSYNLDYNKDGTLGRYGKTGEIMSVRKMLNNAGLITISLGMGDVFNRTLFGDSAELDFSDVSKIPSSLSALLKMLDDAYDYWKGAYPLLLEYLNEHNPNAKVVLVGILNPIENVVTSDDILLPIGAMFNTYTDKMNRDLKNMAKKYGCIYLDINNVDTPTTDAKVSLIEVLEMSSGNPDGFGLIGHPTPAGHEQIGRMIVKAIDKELAKDAAEAKGEEYVPETPATYITTDIGKYEKIDCVKINGKKVKNFTVEDHVLTIPCCTKTAKNMTVSVVKEDGTITTMTYSLKYNKGYTVRRTYVSNDLKGDIKTVINAPVNIAKKAINLIKGLFSK